MILTALFTLLAQASQLSHASPTACVDPETHLKLNRIKGNSQTIVYLDPQRRYSFTWKCLPGKTSFQQAKEQIQKLGALVQSRPGLVEFTSRHGEILSSGFLVQRANGAYDLYQFHRPAQTPLPDLKSFKKWITEGT